MLNFVKREDPVENENTLICFTDGSCVNNGKSCAKSGFAVVWPYHPELNYAEKMTDNHQTNNRAEFTAVIYAIKQADEVLDVARLKTLIVYTDSMLLINSLTQWLPGWKKRGWKKADNKDVLNQDLLKTLDQLIQDRKVVFRHVKAHTNKTDWESVNNDIVDKLAQTIVAM